jgi:hypothetical protein
MKIVMGLLLACFMCFVSMPVDAGSFGLSPAIVSANINAGASKSFQFTISGYNGLVEISAESMPVNIVPSSITVIAETPITVTIICNNNATTGTYDGRIKFLAKSGNSVLSGINVICNLTIEGSSENITLITTVISSGGNLPINPGGSHPNSMPDWASIFPAGMPTTQQYGSSYIPTQQPIDIPPPVVGNPPQTLSTTAAIPEEPSSPVTRMDWIVLLIIVGAACLVGLIIWIISSTIDKNRETA